MNGCAKPVAEPASPGTMTSTSASQQATGENPFAITVMRQAYANLTATAVEPTHLDLRFKPAITN